MFNKIFNSYTKVISLCVLYLLFFSACSMTSKGPTIVPQPFAAIEHKSDWYENQLRESDPQYNFAWQILLARAYIIEGDIPRANQVITQLKENAITPLQGNQADIIHAQTYTRVKNHEKALDLLSTVNTTSLPNDTMSYYYNILGNTQSALNQNIEAAFTYLNLAQYLDEQNKLTAYKKAYLSFEKATNSQLVKAFKTNKENFYRGFIEYTLIEKNKSQNRKKALFTKFLKKYPNHVVVEVAIAAKQEKNTVEQQTQTISNSPENLTIKDNDTIAILLPLTGKYAQIIGEPTKMGLLTAYKDRGYSLNLKFYDTNSNSIAQIYEQLKKDNAKVIIGPIIKSEVEALLMLKPSIPVIALNEASQQNKIDNVYYLTLNPENDSQNVVDKMVEDNITNPLIITAKTQKGARISEAFNQYWFNKTSGNASVCYFTDVNSLLKTLTNCYNQSNRSTAFDGVFIYGTANEASIIREFSKQATNNAHTYYLTGKSNNGIINTSAMSSIRGMKIADQPWLFKDSETKQQILEILPKANGDTLRCFAIGYDSFNVALHLENLISNKQEIQGLSGYISIDENKNLKRKLEWNVVGRK